MLQRTLHGLHVAGALVQIPGIEFAGAVRIDPIQMQVLRDLAVLIFHGLSGDRLTFAAIISGGEYIHVTRSHVAQGAIDQSRLKLQHERLARFTGDHRSAALQLVAGEADCVGDAQTGGGHDIPDQSITRLHVSAPAVVTRVIGRNEFCAARFWLPPFCQNVFGFFAFTGEKNPRHSCRGLFASSAPTRRGATATLERLRLIERGLHGIYGARELSGKLPEHCNHVLTNCAGESPPRARVEHCRSQCVDARRCTTYV